MFVVHQAPFLSAATGPDVAKGSALFPLVVLSAAVLSSKLRNELIKANPLTLSLTGCVAVFATFAGCATVAFTLWGINPLARSA